MRLRMIKALPACQEVALVGQHVERFKDLGDRRCFPGVWLKVVNIDQCLGLVLPQHLVEDELTDVLRVDARRHPRRYAGAFDLFGQRHHLVPGLWIGVALLLHEGVVVPNSVDRESPVEQVLRSVEDTRVLRAGHQTLGKGLAFGVVGRSSHQIGQVRKLPLCHEGRVVQVTCPGVINDVRRVPCDEARLELLAKALDSRVGDLRIGIELAVQVLVHVDGVLITVTTLEDDDIKRCCRVHPERVVGALGQCLHRHYTHNERRHGRRRQPERCGALQDLSPGVASAACVFNQPLDMRLVHQKLLHGVNKFLRSPCPGVRCFSTLPPGRPAA